MRTLPSPPRSALCVPARPLGAVFVAWVSGCSGGDDATPTTPDAGCNGSPDLCDVALDDAVFLVAHNAMNVEDAGWTFPNQHVGYEAQVAGGVRGFMLDVYDIDGTVQLCHGDCALGSEPFADALARFRTLLDDHPGDVYVFVIQDELDAGPVVAAIEDAGLVDRVIDGIPGPGEPWPTLGALVERGTRLLVTHEQPRDGAPSWYYPTYSLAWDNDYASAQVEDFDCAVLRGDAGNDVFLLNHFLTAIVGSEDLAAEANTADALWDHVDRCEAETGDRVSWLAVDFFDVGDAKSVVDALNRR